MKLRNITICAAGAEVRMKFSDDVLVRSDADVLSILDAHARSIPNTGSHRPSEPEASDGSVG